MIKFFGAEVLHDVIDRALQVHGVARLLDRPAARGDVPLRARRRGSTTAPTRSTARRWRARSCAATSRRPDGVPTEHVPTRREAARSKFAELLEAVTSND